MSEDIAIGSASSSEAIQQEDTTKEVASTQEAEQTIRETEQMVEAQETTETQLKTTENLEGEVGADSITQQRYCDKDEGRGTVIDLFTHCCGLVTAISLLQPKLELQEKTYTLLTY